MSDGIRDFESDLVEQRRKQLEEEVNAGRWQAHYAEVKNQETFKQRFDKAVQNMKDSQPSIFRAYQCSEGQTEAMNEVRDLFTYLYRNLNNIYSLESSRLGAITKSKLEEACMFAVKNIAEGGSL